ncbi:TauD/TfdA family dioxygenase [Caballeronia sp. dw_19]|uniref:TauD/TfdA dioxygenase family protein n=1 Tax=Caballeronia sp. dw_19 TaxID=2719791 RepID=UPI001BD26650|nr:TauD/TfdA family dioxygenase [Caballeronia sp. dw_19]
MESKPFAIKPLAPFGAQVVGLDMHQPVSEAERQVLREAFSEHALLLFRDQDLDKADLLRVADIFGKVSEQGEAPGGFNYVSNLHPRGLNAAGEMILAAGDGELQFHFDHCFQENVLKAILLYGVEIPPTGGDTLFSDMRLVTRHLPDEIRERIDDKIIRHKSDTRAGCPQADHPIMYPHPRTGERVLFFSKLHARQILGLSVEESQALFQRFISMIENKEIMYRHVWAKRDLVVWDNLALQHARETFDPKYKRHLQRLQID